MIILPQKTFDEFYNITGIELKDFYTRLIDFLTNDQVNIINYYSGVIKTVPSDSIKILDSLLKECKSLLIELSLHIDILNNVYWWDLQENLQEIETNLDKIKQISLFLRSNTNKELGSIVSQPISYNETVETILDDKFNYNDPQNQSQNVLIKNNYIEEDYSPDSGISIDISSTPTSNLFQLNSILDNDIQGEKLYGYDINRKITFEDNDLQVLEPKDTMLQTISILTSLLKKNNPEFPKDGLDLGLLVGTSVGSLSFPTILRQLVSLFKTDDTISSFSVVDIKTKGDRVEMEFEVTTVYGESIITTQDY
jgi:hypothetical protein